jgi:hypothetical protein
MQVHAPAICGASQIRDGVAACHADERRKSNPVQSSQRLSLTIVRHENIKVTDHPAADRTPRVHQSRRAFQQYRLYRHSVERGHDLLQFTTKCCVSLPVEFGSERQVAAEIVRQGATEDLAAEDAVQLWDEAMAIAVGNHKNGEPVVFAEGADECLIQVPAQDRRELLECLVRW